MTDMTYLVKIKEIENDQNAHRSLKEALRKFDRMDVEEALVGIELMKSIFISKKEWLKSL